MQKNEPNVAVLALLARVRRLNKRNGVSIVSLADRTGMQPNNVSRMLQGKYNMRLDKFLQILEAGGLQITLRKIPKNKVV